MASPTVEALTGLQGQASQASSASHVVLSPHGPQRPPSPAHAHHTSSTQPRESTSRPGCRVTAQKFDFGWSGGLWWVAWKSAQIEKSEVHTARPPSHRGWAQVCPEGSLGISHPPPMTGRPCRVDFRFFDFRPFGRPPSPRTRGHPTNQSRTLGP